MSGMPTLVAKNRPARESISQPAMAAPRIPFQWLRAPLFAILVLATTAFGVWTMFDILRANGVTGLEISLLALFSITFAWVTTAFWSAIFGFTLQLLRIDPLTLKRLRSVRNGHHKDYNGPRTAIVMPVYNEDPERVCAGAEASLRSLQATGKFDYFDFYLLSDTQDPQAARRELQCWHALLKRMGAAGDQLFYRRREKNVHRKVGNIADFCERWGHHYEGMIVLDADSIMNGDCMLQLAQALQDHPRAGLVQTVPIPVRQTTFFGRFVQYASVLYSPMLATGQAFWQTDKANYWGHNAIIRVDAFIQHCGLPVLPGKAPFGGEILSHDFVEAALMRRAGWQVLLYADVEGSYEEVPSNILDYATRDRRWVQGNIQHLGLLAAKGLFSINRLHFLMGAIAYLSSLIWLGMLGLSTVDAVMRAETSNVFFGQGYQLFPDWRIAKTELIMSLLVLTACMLLVPKLLGIIVALVHRRREFGGTFRLLAGALVEMVFAVLIAPLMMVFHGYFVLSVLFGLEVSWDAQSRGGRMVPWREALRRTWVLSSVAIGWGALAYYYATTFFWWLSPVLLGMLLAAPIVRYSSSLKLGRWMRKVGVFVSPSETRRDPVLTRLHDLEMRPVADYVIPGRALRLPLEVRRTIPEQAL